MIFKETLIEKALKTTPRSIKIYDRRGELAMNLEGDAIHFDPGSGALTILDPKSLEQREPPRSWNGGECGFQVPTRAGT